jgi:hypothetical protein
LTHTNDLCPYISLFIEEQYDAGDDFSSSSLVERFLMAMDQQDYLQEYISQNISGSEYSQFLTSLFLMQFVKNQSFVRQIVGDLINFADPLSPENLLDVLNHLASLVQFLKDDSILDNLLKICTEVVSVHESAVNLNF